MFTKEYTDYIKSEKWRAVCGRYWRLNGRKCKACGATRHLHVHHKTYERLGHERLTDLCGLCQSCHRKVHAIHRSNRKVSLRTVTDRYVIKTRIRRLAYRTVDSFKR